MYVGGGSVGWSRCTLRLSHLALNVFSHLAVGSGAACVADTCNMENCMCDAYSIIIGQHSSTCSGENFPTPFSSQR